MKKIVSFILVGILAFSLCGCTDSDDKAGSDLSGTDKILDQQGEQEDAPVKDGVVGVELPDLDVSGKNESAQSEDNKTQTEKEETKTEKEETKTEKEETQSSDTPVSSEKEETQSPDTPVSSDKEETSQTEQSGDKTELKDQNVADENEGSSNSESQEGSAGAEAPSGGIELPDFDF